MDPATLRKRLKALREEKDLTQEEFSKSLGFENRQTLSAIESGERRITAAELIKAAQVLGVSLDHFTDPFLLIGEGRFSWRKNDVTPEALAGFEAVAGRWIAAYRYLAHLKGELPTVVMLPKLPLTREDSFEDALEAGERIAAEWGLAPVPSVRLQEIMETELGTLVLHADAEAHISGAACRLPELNAALVNRHEAEGRRSFDLAHELFHLLTWEAMPPSYDDKETPQRVEQLANNFASALLMPKKLLAPYLEGFDKTEPYDWLNTSALALGVTSAALAWRLVNLGLLTRAELKGLDETRLRNNGRPEGAGAENAPRLFSKRFMEMLGWGILEGHLSARRAAEVVQLTLDDLAALFVSYGMKAPFSL